MTAGDHYVTDIIDPRGLAPVQYLYEDGVLVGVKDAKGQTIQLQHNIGQRNEVVTDREGNISIYTYNDRGNVVRLRDALGNVTIHTYDEESEHADDVKTTTVIMPDEPNAVTRYDYVYYSDGRLKEHTVFDPENNLTETEYDAIGNVTDTSQCRLKDPCYPGDYVEVARSENEYYWNDNGTLNTTLDGVPTNLLAVSEVITHFDDPCDPEDKERIERTKYEYDEQTNQLERVIKAGTVVTEYGYDKDESNSADQPWSITDAAGLFIQYFAYDENGNQTESWYKWKDAADPCNSATVSTITEYDAAGRVKRTWRQVSNATGNVQDYTVLLSETQYNSIGKVDWAVNENGVLTKYEYDNTGSLVETIVYESKAAFDAWYWDYPNSLDGVLTVGRTLYDAEGRVRVSVGPYDPCETVNGTENIYDAVGRIVETRRWANVEIQMADITNAQGQLIGRKSTGWLKDTEPLSYSRTEYDHAGRVESTFVLDEAGSEQATSYEYDLAGKQVKVIDPNFGVTETHYLGNRRDWAKDARGNVTYFDYDALGRIIKTTYPATAQNPETYTYVKYDKFGRKSWESEQTAEVDPNDALKRQFEYDAAGRLVKVILPEVEDPNNGFVLTRPVYEYVYDIYGNQVAIIDPYDRETSFTYNEIHKQVSRTLPGGRTEYKDYDEFGRLILAEDFKGQVTTYEYNYRGQLAPAV
jgi:YD repeat-containing protein